MVKHFPIINPPPKKKKIIQTHNSILKPKFGFTEITGQFEFDMPVDLTLHVELTLTEPNKRESDLHHENSRAAQCCYINLYVEDCKEDPVALGKFLL